MITDYNIVYHVVFYENKLSKDLVLNNTNLCVILSTHKISKIKNIVKNHVG